jgi:hypothetical protein
MYSSTKYLVWRLRGAPRRGYGQLDKWLDMANLVAMYDYGRGTRYVRYTVSLTNYRANNTRVLQKHKQTKTHRAAMI